MRQKNVYRNFVSIIERRKKINLITVGFYDDKNVTIERLELLSQ